MIVQPPNTPPRSDLRGRNNIFIIYNDGSYFNSYLFQDYDWDDSIVTSNPQESYSVIAPKSIGYLYYTNVYEGDDPEPETRVTSNGGGFDLLDVTGMQQNQISTNHDVARGRDVTVIIDNNDGRCKGSFDLCWQMNGMTLPSDLFSESTVFTDGSTFNYLKGFSNNRPISTADRCIKGLQLNGNYGYINLRTKDLLNSAIVDKDLIFSIIGSEECNRNFPVKVRDSHDPNFIEVKCIEEINDSTFKVKYRLETLNDGNLSVSPISIEFNFPSILNIYNNEVNVINYGILDDNNVDKSGSPYGTSTVNLGNNNRFELSFGSNTLNTFETAYIDFCIELVIRDTDTYNIQDIDLRPINAQTDYNGQPWDIIHFIDLPCADEELINNEQNEKKESATVYRYCKRNVKGDCGCGLSSPPTYCWKLTPTIKICWYHLLGIGLILLLLWRGVFKRRKN